MKKKDIALGQDVYYNTTGAFEKKISIRSKVIDIGKNWIWILCAGNLGYSNVIAEQLSTEPLYEVTNKNIKFYM